MSPSHFSLKANSYSSPDKAGTSVEDPLSSMKKKSSKVKKVNIKGSILDDIRVDEHGKHFLPSKSYISPEKFAISASEMSQNFNEKQNAPKSFLSSVTSNLMASSRNSNDKKLKTER